MKAGPPPPIAPVNPAFTFILLSLKTCVTSADAAPIFLSGKTSNTKTVGQAVEKKKTKKKRSHRDEDLHLNGLFLSTGSAHVAMLLCFPVLAGKLTSGCELSPTPPPTPPLPRPERKKKVPFVYLCCVMSVLNLNSLLSNSLNYCRVLILYTRCAFHWLKL